MTKFILAFLSFMVISFSIAYPWHMIWFHDLYVAWGAFSRIDPIMPLGLSAMTIQGLVIAYLYPSFHRPGHPVLQGVKFSLLMGLMVYSVMGLATAAKFQIEPVMTFLTYHTAFQFLQFVFTGIALGLIYGRKT